MQLFKRKKKNRLQQYKTYRRNQIIKKKLRNLLPENKKKLNITLKDKLRFKIASISNKEVNRMAGAEILHRASFLPATLTNSLGIKKVLVRMHQRKTDKQGATVKSYFRSIVSTKVPAFKEKDLKDFRMAGSNKIASANSTFIVKDKFGKKYVYKESPFNPQFDLGKNLLGFKYSRRVGHQVSEAFYSDLAQRHGIKSQKTIIVPVGVKRPFGNSNQPATLHEFVPGIEALEAKEKGWIKEAGFALKPTTDRRTEKKHNWDFKLNTAFSHKDTSKLLAADIFTSNMDRHPNNYFFDKASNSFYGIDHGESLAIRPDFFGIRMGIANSYDKLNNKQRRNLKEFKNTLKQIVKDNPPEVSQAKLDKYYKKVTSTQSKKEQFYSGASIQRKKEIVEKNYYDSVELINWMEKAGI